MEIPRDIGAITMFIADVQRSKRFYESVFDVQPIYEDENAVAFQFDHIIVNLLREPAAHELIEPALVGSADAGARFQLTIGVDDCDSTVAELTSRGATPVPPVRITARTSSRASSALSADAIAWGSSFTISRTTTGCPPVPSSSATRAPPVSVSSVRVSLTVITAVETCATALLR